MKYVIAENHQQFRYYFPRGSGALYITGAMDLHGIQLGPDDEIVKVGTAYRRSDYDDLMRQVAVLEATRTECDEGDSA